MTLSERFNLHQAALTQWLDILEAELPSIVTALIPSLISGKVLICGNGGSAADSQHLAAELVSKFEHQRHPLAAVALTVDSSILTAVANDDAFTRVFARQVEALGRPADALIAISTSGQSGNVLAAIQAAKLCKMVTISLTGKPGTPLSSLSDFSLVAPTNNTACCQEMHIFAIHCLCGLIDDLLSIS